MGHQRMASASRETTDKPRQDMRRSRAERCPGWTPVSAYGKMQIIGDILAKAIRSQALAEIARACRHSPGEWPHTSLRAAAGSRAGYPARLVSQERRGVAIPFPKAFTPAAVLR